ncbi:MAG: SDR family oxidoreductase [Candidatus Kapabacteria bacterium]|nr:SDR family oxidoreductase [Candidatus Kapabacteria bacterium]MDW8011535.1 SDR family oxidoreductase [Bacteroidota bacterium]
MKVLIVGARSKTAEALLRLVRRHRLQWEMLLISHQPGEPTVIHGYPVHVVLGYSRQLLRELCRTWEPEVIVNLAAITDVDACEQNRSVAWQVNVELVETLASVCRILGAHLIQLSSDYVFDGVAGPYDEQAYPRPINYYGRTKLAAENVCWALAPSATVIRTTQIFGTPAPWCSDVVGWAVRRALAGERVAVAEDVYTNPTFVDDLAQALIVALQDRVEGVIHIAGRMWLSRYDFLRQAFEIVGLPGHLLVPRPASELYQGRASRPRYGGLHWRRAEELLGLRLRSLEDALWLTSRRLHSVMGMSGKTAE